MKKAKNKIINKILKAIIAKILILPSPLQKMKIKKGENIKKKRKN
jgi:hypothetical protein